MDRDDYKKKIQREKIWYQQNTQPPPSLSQRILNSKLFINRKRILFPYDMAKKQLAQNLKTLYPNPVEKLLIAPCGSGNDFKYLSPFGKKIHGIDISSTALASCPPGMICKEADILQTDYPEEYFDIIVSPLIFHHFVQFGFDPFLSSFYKLLKPGGTLVILEPSLWFPINIITRPIKWLFNNPFGEVEDEGPFSPRLLIEALNRCGYKNVQTKGATFSHPALPIPISKAITYLSMPFLEAGGFKHLAWLVLFFGNKPDKEK